MICLLGETTRDSASAWCVLADTKMPNAAWTADRSELFFGGVTLRAFNSKQLFLYCFVVKQTAKY